MSRPYAPLRAQRTEEEYLYIISTYRSPSRLFISGRGKIFSQEVTTQGDPLAMPLHEINTFHMIHNLRPSTPQVKQVWLWIESLYQWYKSLCQEGRKYGYIINGPKSWLIVKSSEQAEDAKKEFGEEVNITLEGRRHIGAVIGSKGIKGEISEFDFFAISANMELKLKKIDVTA